MTKGEQRKKRGQAAAERAAPAADAAGQSAAAPASARGETVRIRRATAQKTAPGGPAAAADAPAGTEGGAAPSGGQGGSSVPGGVLAALGLTPGQVLRSAAADGRLTIITTDGRRLRAPLTEV